MKNFIKFLILILIIVVLLFLLLSSKETSFSFAKEEDGFKILDKSSGEVVFIPNKEFQYGSVAYEMSPSFEEEALKAQAIAAYTFFSRKRKLERENPNIELKGADFSADLKNGEFYFSKELMREKFGDRFEESYKKITEAVDQVSGKVIKNSEEPILATYYAISGGNTENCCDIFTQDLEYLRSVPSPGDLLAPGYKTCKEFSKEEFEIIIQNNFKEFNSVEDIKKLKKSEVRSAFALRSPEFDLDFCDDKYVFTVRGFGHGVGMSQYGAEYMARQGASYNEILSWYYPNTSIE